MCVASGKQLLMHLVLKCVFDERVTGHSVTPSHSLVLELQLYVCVLDLPNVLCAQNCVGSSDLGLRVLCFKGTLRSTP